MRKIYSFVTVCLLGIVALGADCIEPARAAGYTLVFDRTFHLGNPSAPSKGTSLARTGNSGYVVAGITIPWRPFILKIGADGRKRWEHLFADIGETLYDFAVVGDEDGGALLIGSADSVAYAVRLGRDGDVTWKKAYAMVDGIRAGGSFACGTRVKGGFILVGRNTAGVDTNGVIGYEQLSVLKLDDSGNKIWETGTFEDGEEKFNPLHLGPRGCSAPIVDAKGNIAFAVAVQAQAPFDLAFKFDANGKEIARLRLDNNGQAPRLLRTRTGYVLIDRNVSSSEERGELLHYLLDSNLAVLSKQEIARTRDLLFVTADAIWRDPSGGIHLGGLTFGPKTDAVGMAMAYLDSNGAIVSLKNSGFGTLWEPVGIVQGDTPNEVVLLVRTTNDIKLMKFRLSR